MNLLQALRHKGTRRGPRQPVRITLGQEPKHRDAVTYDPWFVPPAAIDRRAIDAIGRDQLGLRHQDAGIDCTTEGW